jgi:predicted metal-binding membrane protein
MTAVAAALERRRGRVPWLVLSAIGAAWTLAVAADRTGWARALHNHGEVPRGTSLWAALLLFLLAWQAMIAAMMLPSSLPLIRLFEAASRSQEHVRRVRAVFLAGYVAVWTVFGAIAFLGDLGLHRAVDHVPTLAERPQLLAGTILGLAGVFQFSDLKDRCLSKCRHPAPYLLAHYRRGEGAAFRLGLGHGIFCLGCCWALMLVMFALGAAVLWWMAALTALMVYEKVGRHGAAAARVAGVALIAAAVLLLAHPGWLPTALGGSKEFASELRVGPGPVTRVMHVNSYQVTLRIAENRAASLGIVSLHVSRNGRPVNGAHVRTTFEMLDMAMANVRTVLPQTAPGTYSASGPALAMPGRWGVRFEVAAGHTRSQTFSVVDEIRP